MEASSHPMPLMSLKASDPGERQACEKGHKDPDIQGISKKVETYRKRLFEKGCDFLETPYPILCGAMTWISESNLVAGIANSGGFGMLACGAMGPQDLALEIDRTRAKTHQAFGVNVIVFHEKIQELLEVCRDKKVTHVCFAGGLPPSKLIDFLKNAGIKILAFAPSLPVAKRLMRMGVDALIIEGSEAGGHVGSISTSVLAQEILPGIEEVPVFVAGGIGCGLSILMYLEMGASGCQLGTRFACAQESIAHSRFKEAFLKAHSRDAVLSPQLDPRFPVIPVRALSNSGTQKFLDIQKKVIQKHDDGDLSLKQAQMEIEHFWAGALRRAVLEGDVEYGSLMAGQSVGLVKAIQPCQEIINDLLNDMEKTLKHRFSWADLP
jgi:enoyl-[acyl-carrier protein] reductase II